MILILIGFGGYRQTPVSRKIRKAHACNVHLLSDCFCGYVKNWRFFRTTTYQTNALSIYLICHIRE